MQIIKTLLKLCLFALPFHSIGQSTYIPLGSYAQHFLDRQQILREDGSRYLFTEIGPYNRKHGIELLFQSASRLKHYSQKTVSMDSGYDWRAYLNDNAEWSETYAPLLKSKKSIGPFYSHPAHFYQVDHDDLYLSVDPVIYFSGSSAKDNTGRFFQNTRGVAVRGRIAHKIGFYSYITDNQERDPSFFRELVDSTYALPGVGFYKPFRKTGYDYFDGRGYLCFPATKFIDVQFGYDKNFIGNGYRSLFLSDYGNSYLFLKLNTRIWRLNYQNLFIELMPQFRTSLGNVLLDRKYAAMHHLSWNVHPRLNVGVFESVIFSRRNHFEFQYLNPVIFYRHIEGALGSADNALAGLDVRWNWRQHGQIYGQFLMDEFLLNKVKNDPGNWVNKFGFQIGSKYIDAFGIKNLDLQLEWNRVRPFTYSHKDTLANYTHYNQPLAHPLGANFGEWVGVVRYKPSDKWYLNARVIRYSKGLDSAGINFGGNIFRDYNTRSKESGYTIGSGKKADCFNANINISYELNQNLFIEWGYFRRVYREEGKSNRKDDMLSLGLRMNFVRRNYEL